MQAEKESADLLVLFAFSSFSVSADTPSDLSDWFRFLFLCAAVSFCAHLFLTILLVCLILLLTVHG